MPTTRSITLARLLRARHKDAKRSLLALPTMTKLHPCRSVSTTNRAHTSVSQVVRPRPFSIQRLTWADVVAS